MELRIDSLVFLVGDMSIDVVTTKIYRSDVFNERYTNENKTEQNRIE